MMKRYWQFLVVGIICLLVALLWAQPPRPRSVAPVVAAAAAQGGPAPSPSRPAAAKAAPRSGNDQQPLPGSSSSLPLLAVIGFGVLAGGITSAMRTR